MREKNSLDRSTVIRVLLYESVLIISANDTNPINYSAINFWMAMDINMMVAMCLRKQRY